MSTLAGEPYQFKELQEADWQTVMMQKKVEAMQAQMQMEQLKAQIKMEVSKDGRDDYIDKLKFIIEAQATTIKAQETALAALGEAVKHLKGDNAELRGVMHL